jgi:KAP-like P-loop domain-containing protein
MTEIQELTRGELIDDSALESVADDRFRHLDVASELSALVRTVPAPANIALFGPWGSGKTSLAHMLGHSLAEHNKNASGASKKVRFVKFDAFKYAELPLRKHFVTHLAKAARLSQRSARESPEPPLLASGPRCLAHRRTVQAASLTG